MKTIRFYGMLLCFFILVSTAHSQQQQSTYGGQEQRQIKALSDDEVTDLLEGKGMGFAKAAELNHYPGPKHVLELAEKLALNVDQITLTRGVFRKMEMRAKQLGIEYVESERALDELFRNQKADPAEIKKFVQKIAEVHGKLRLAHLEAHLEMKEILTGHQVLLYDKLRGYGQPGAHQHHSGH